MKNEKMANITAELRDLCRAMDLKQPTYDDNLLTTTVFGNTIRNYFSELADRIDAVWKREMATAEKSSVVGNVKKMREALVYIKQWHEDCISEEGADLVDDMIAKVDAALSAPPRNCDVGTAEEQNRRHNAFCNATRNGMSGYHCEDAPRCVFCFSKWAQMPYKSEEAS